MAAQKNCYVPVPLCYAFINECLSTQGSYCQAGNFMFNRGIKQHHWVAVINGFPLVHNTIWAEIFPDYFLM